MRTGFNQGSCSTLTRAGLIGMLGGPVATEPREADADLRTHHIDLQPGEVLFRQGQPAQHVYLIEQGLIEQVSRSVPGTHGTPRVTFACTHELLGLHHPGDPQPATAIAVTATRLLGWAHEDLQPLQGTTPLLTELMARRAGLALKDELRAVFRLREMPAMERPLAGLVHLTRMACAHDPGLLSSACLSTSLQLQRFQDWLGLTAGEMFDALLQLITQAGLVLRDQRIVALSPRRTLTRNGERRAMGANFFEGV